jgi:hypothetical protein
LPEVVGRNPRQRGSTKAWPPPASSTITLGGSDAPDEAPPEDPELQSSSLGGTARSEEPATQSGIDLGAGDNADATSQGGPDTPEGTEPDLKDTASGARQADVESAG